MKALIIAFTIVYSMSGGAQESLKKRYYIPDNYHGNYLKKEVVVDYKDMTDAQKAKIYKQFPYAQKISYQEKELINGTSLIREKEQIIDSAFYRKQKVVQVDSVVFSSDEIKKIKANIKFDNATGKLYVNPRSIKFIDDTKYKEGLFKNVDTDNVKRVSNFRKDNATYYFSLKDRERIRLWFAEGVITSFAIPLKYRFKGKGGLDEDFSSSFNINFFVGWAFGKTTFFRRKKVDMISNTWKLNIGIIGGASTVTLNKANTNNLIEEDVIKGLASLGCGVTFTINKINFGAFLGKDFGVGNDSNKWIYDSKPWLGIGIGYSLFKL